MVATHLRRFGNMRSSPVAIVKLFDGDLVMKTLLKEKLAPGRYPQAGGGEVQQEAAGIAPADKPSKITSKLINDCLLKTPG